MNIKLKKKKYSIFFVFLGLFIAVVAVLFLYPVNQDNLINSMNDQLQKNIKENIYKISCTSEYVHKMAQLECNYLSKENKVIGEKNIKIPSLLSMNTGFLELEYEKNSPLLISHYVFNSKEKNINMVDAYFFKSLINDIVEQ